MSNKTVIYCMSKSVRLYGTNVNISLFDDQRGLAQIVLLMYRQNCSIFFVSEYTYEHWTAIENHIATMFNLNPKLNESAKLN